MGKRLLLFILIALPLIGSAQTEEAIYQKPAVPARGGSVERDYASHVSRLIADVGGKKQTVNRTRGSSGNEAYAVFTDDGTLTFYYDSQKNSRDGATYELNTGANVPGWYREREKIYQVVFKPSFSNARPTSTFSWFEGDTNLTDIEGIRYLNTSSVTNMSWMFWDCISLTSIDVRGFNTSNVINMRGMFGCEDNNESHLESLDVSGFDTKNVTDMGFMFWNCINLSSVNVSGFVTSNVTDMKGMFGCYKRNSNLTHLDVSGFDTRKVTDTSIMFQYLSNLKTLDVSNFDTRKVENMAWMFWGCSGLTNLDLRNFDTSKVTSMHEMFEDCYSLKTLDLSSFNTANVTDMSWMFDDCHNLTSLDLSSFNTASVTDMNRMFSCCYSLTSLDLRRFNTVNVTNMYAMFDECYALTSLFLSSFNTANVTDMSWMFGDCQKLTSLDLSGFNTASVTNMSSMFCRCYSLRSLDLSSFNTTNVMYMSWMFNCCYGLTNLVLSSFNTANVTSMYAMFDNCRALTSLDLSGFNTSDVTEMRNMFSYCYGLTTICASSGWSTNSVTNSEFMFYSCTNLVGEAGTHYDADHTDYTYAHIDEGSSNPGYFTYKRSEQKPHEISLTVNVKYGLLTASFNSIPNDLRYRLTEKSGTGAVRKVYETQRSHYPNTVRAFDFPPADGTYSYYVSAVYTDANGEEKGVKSNEVSVTFETEKIDEKPEFGSIVGRVAFNNKTDIELPPHIIIDVVFSDDGSKVRLEPNGTFHRDGIPIGQSVTLKIEDDDYFTYKPITVLVTKDTQNEVQVIEATLRENIDLKVFNNSYDLMIDNFLNAAPEYFEMDVFNTKNQPWTGVVELIAFKKEEAKNVEKLMDSGVSFSMAKPFYVAGRAYVEKLSTGASKHLKIEIKDFPTLNKDERYKFYFVSKRSEQSMSSSYKILSFRDKELFNPMDVLMTAQEPKYKSEKFPEIPSELDAYLMDVFDTMKTFDKIDGPMGEACQKLAELMEQYERKRDLKGFYGNLPDILKSFKEDLANAVKDVKDFTDIFEKTRKFYKELETTYNLLNPNKTKRDEVKSFVTICKKIWELSGDPFSKIYCCYLDVLEKSAEKILKLQEKLVDAQIDDIFNNNEITFKLRVAHERDFADYITFSTHYYNPDYVDERIKDIEIHMITMKPEVTPDLTQFEYSLHPSNGIESWAAYQVSGYDGDAVILRRDNSRSMINVNMDYAVVRFWMKIRWKNGRVSTIPLYRDCTDWDIVGQGAKAVITVTMESTTYPMDDKIYLKY